MLQQDYDTLKSNVILLEQQLEDKSQELYDYKKRLALATALEGDYLQEIEALQSLENAKVEELQRKRKRLEESITNLRDTYNPELLKKADLIENLQSQITELMKNSCKDVEPKEDDHFNEEAQRQILLKEEIRLLSYNLVEIQMNIDSLQKQSLALEESSNNLHKELDGAKQSLTCKVQELKEAKHLIHDLQEDIFLIKLDLDSLKSKPLDPVKQGNSLFAEVEDSRIKMEQNILQMKKTYAEMKRTVLTKLKKMVALRTQNLELSRQLDEINDFDEEYDKQIEAYNVKVSTLESINNEYKQEILKEQKFTGKDLPSYAVDFANNTIKNKWNDIEKARENLDCESKVKLETFKEIQRASTEKRKWRRKTQQLKVKIEEMESSILEMQLQNIPINTTEGKPTCNVLETKPRTQDKDGLTQNIEKSRKTSGFESRVTSTVLETIGNTSSCIKAPRLESKIDVDYGTRKCQSSNNFSNITGDQNELFNKLDSKSSNNKRESFNSDTLTKTSIIKVERFAVESNIATNNNAEINFKKHILEDEGSQKIGPIIDKNFTKCIQKSNKDSSLINNSNNKQKLLSYMDDIGYTPVENPMQLAENASLKIELNEEKHNLFNNAEESLLYVNYLHASEEIQNLYVENTMDDIIHIDNLTLKNNEEPLQKSYNNENSYIYNTGYESANNQDESVKDITNKEYFNYEVSVNNEDNSLLYVNDAGHTPAPNRKQIIGYYTLTTPECPSKDSPEFTNNCIITSSYVNKARHTFPGNHQRVLEDVLANRYTTEFCAKNVRKESDNREILLAYTDDVSTPAANQNPNIKSLDENEVVHNILTTNHNYSKHYKNTNKIVSKGADILTPKCYKGYLENKENVSSIQYTANFEETNAAIKKSDEIKIANGLICQQEQTVLKCRTTSIPVLIKRK